jgi:hypothetical protein
MLSASSAAAAPATDYTYRGPVFRTQQLEIGQFVGKGSFGDVYFAKLTDSDGVVKDVAVKQFVSEAGGPARAFRSNFMKESAIHMHLADGCPFITQLVGITDGDCWQVLERLGLYEVSTLASCSVPCARSCSQRLPFRTAP